MLRFIFLWYSIMLSIPVLSQKKYTYSSAYRPYTLNEKNLIRLNTETHDSIQYLIPYKDFLKETTSYFNKHISQLSPITKIEVINKQDHYYLVQYSNTQTIISYLHATIRPTIQQAFFLVLGSNHCIIPSQQPLCYPNLQPLSCLHKQLYCEKLDTKK
jgi:hypothetical protein